ncbi:MAG TPA: RHS repeat-associated core domain-containing protein [Anaerolineae bacterium]|nr:RHS repeat-associated core domain-containing protein [Anaerolineae bacterium]
MSLRLQRLQVSGGLLDLGYTYDHVGNITQIVDTSNGGQIQTFGYDARDRLVGAQTNAAGNGQYHEAYSYDRMGNILTRTGSGQAVAYVYGCPPRLPAPGLPPTLTQRVYFPLVLQGFGPDSPPAAACVAPFAVVSTSAGFRAAYDANGNMVTRTENGGTYQQQFDAENRLSVVTDTVTGQVTRFVYDGDGNRVLRIGPEGTTVYIGDYYEKQGSLVTKYYYAGGQRVAMRQGSIVYYLHGDHLGSATLATSAGGSKIGEMRYYPYGGTRSGSMPTDRQYTGQRRESSLGFYDFVARQFDPALGRFLQADTLVPNPENPQSLNRYAYVLGNPLRLVDPSGHKYCDSFDANGRCVSENEAFWVRFRGGWGGDYMVAVQSGAEKVGTALADALNGSARERRAWIATGDRPVTAQEAFQLVYGNNRLVFRHIEGDPIAGWAETHLDWAGNGCYRGEICYDESIFDATHGLEWTSQNVAHELGHGFDQRGGRQARADLNAAQIGYVDPGSGQVVPVAGGGWGGGYVRTPFGYSSRGMPWQQNTAATPGEDFADMFLGWSFNNFAPGQAGAARNSWMSANMPGWMALAVAGN